MAHLDQQEAFQEFKSQVLTGIKANFPLEGRMRRLDLEALEVDDHDFNPDDIRAQKEARLLGKSWGAPVKATMALTDIRTGEVLQRRTLKIADIPYTTRRHGYILDGQEYQVDNQWQLKPGAYTRRRQSGELETRFNIPNNKSFDITFDAKSRLFLMDRGKSKSIPVYPLMKAMGVDDAVLEKQWGKDVLAANQGARAVGTALQRFYKADLKKTATGREEAEKYFLQTMAESKLRPDATAVTLGHPFETVNGDALLRATTKMIGVQQGRIPEDDRDSLVFKDLRSVGDFAHDKLTNWKTTQSIKSKAARQFGESKGIRDIVKFDTFNEPIRDPFLRNAAANPGKQINPVEMLSSAMRTTIMGPGGIKSSQAVMDEAKLINPSHLGFLDCIHTPESEKTGVSLHLPLGVKKVGRTPMIPAYNIQTGKMERISPATFLSSNVVLPDQVEWRSGKPVPLKPAIKMAARGDNIVRTGKFSEAQYVMRHPSHMFSITSNLIPFLGNNQGGRAMYATHHLEQAISLVHRDEPLVQVGTGNDKPGLRTFEEFLGRTTGHVSPVDGTVTKIGSDFINVTDAAGKPHEVQFYNNFPLNDPKAVFHSQPIVKIGDKVVERQALADTNYTRNGKLALGTNLRVAYLPYKGYNFEDGVVISENAAQKLSSMHLHKPVMRLDKNVVSDPRKFNVEHPEAFTRDQLKKLDGRGVIQLGQIVQTGDPLVLGTRPYNLQDRTGSYAIRKNSSGSQTDVSLRWESDYPGAVVGVHEGKKGEIAVHVRTVEPMQVGDKITGRHGNKGICTRVLPDKEMPHTKAGEHVEVLLNPAGIPGRVNIGQVLETAASKIAIKTGKPYIVENFLGSDDMLTHVESELKKHKLSDTEELFDPQTGASLGKVLTGHQYMLKLTHQIDKKLSVRSGTVIPGGHVEGYDLNIMPSSGGKTGGQSMGNLGLYGLLAHGAKANIREMQTWKSEGEDPAPEHKQWKSQHQLVWGAIQNGDPLPVPKSTFAFQKFTDMLRGAGVNVEKQGNTFKLTPLTDHQILKMSRGVLTNPAALTRTELDDNGNPKPIAGGLFDPKVTGGHDGKNWSHFKLAEPVPNPLFEGAIQKVLGLTNKQYTAVIQGEKSVDLASGQFTALGTKGSIAGGPAIAHLLSRIDVKGDLAKARAELASAPMPKNLAFGADTQKVDKALKKIKYLRTLDSLELSPREAYVLNYMPVIPPAMRPVSVLPSEKRVNIKWADLNGLYRDIGMLNKKMENPTFQKYLGDEDKKEQRAGMYDAVKALMGVGANFAERGDKAKGILLQIAGKQPKCFDAATDVLTINGWVPFPAYDRCTPIATVDLVRDELVWASPESFTVSDVDGEMLRTVGRDVDLLVTGNHNHVTSGCSWSGSDRVWSAWCREDATKLLCTPGKRRRMMTAPLNWRGAEPELPLGTNSLLLASLVGWWVAEGWVGYYKGEPRYVYWCQCNAEGVDALDSLFEGAGLPFKRSEHKNGTLVYWRVKNEDLGRWLVLNCGSGSFNKHLSHQLLAWDQRYLVALLEGYLEGEAERKVYVCSADSPTYNRAVGKPRGRFSTVSRALFDDLQHLAVKAGVRVVEGEHQTTSAGNVVYRGTVRPFRDVTVSDCKGVETRWEHYKGKVYGPTVPCGTVVVRRNGRPAVSGNSGFFQKTLLNRRQDLTMRSTIVPEPSLGLDQVGLPTEKALSLFRPFVIKKMIDIGVSAHALDAQKLLGTKDAAKDPNILKALDLAMEDRPILLKRDPVLHKHGVQAFRAVRAPGRAIQIHPLVTSGYNADFDGDTMSAYVPISKEAVDEAYKMFPSNNLFNESTGRVTYTPSGESALGLYKLTYSGAQTGKKFKDPAELLTAAHHGSIKMNDVASVEGVGKTTAGRVLVASALPEVMQAKMLTDHNYALDKGNLPQLYMDIAKKHPEHFSVAANRLKDLGYDASYGAVRIPNPSSGGADAIHAAEHGTSKYIHMPTHTLSFDDFRTDHATRDHIVKETQGKVDSINKLKITQSQKDERAVELWSAATQRMVKEHAETMKDHPSNLSLMLNTSGAKVKTGYQQIKLGPMLLEDTKGRVIPTPVTRSYSEGLDLAGYWTQMHGARKGTVQKVQEVQEPGSFTKNLINTSMNLVVNGHDCGTTRGIGLPVTSKDVHDRILAADFNVKGVSYPAGMVLSPDVVTQMRTADKTAIVPVRSALKCEHGHGLCQLCAGISPTGHTYELGTNLGVLASQSVGEPSTQLALRIFHTGGIVEGKKNVIGQFGRVQQLTSLPRKIPDEATLAMTSGTISKIKHDKLGSTVTVNGQEHFIPLDRAGRKLTEAVPGLSQPNFMSWSPLKVGMKVSAGDPLSDPARTFVNPHDLYRATNNMEVVQNHIVRELHSLYEDVGVRRPHIETLVKAMGNLTRVRDSGDAANVLKGEYQQSSHVRAINRELVAKGKRPIEHTPILQGINVLPLNIQEDWMAKMNFQRLRGTIAEAAAMGGVSHLHGEHPVPAMAFGAEFGLTSKNVRTHPHLKGVPEYGY